MWPGRARAAKRAELQSFGAPPNLFVAVLFVLVFFSLNASCERSSTTDQKGVKQAFQRYHACLGRKVSNAVGRPSKPLPRKSLDKHVGSISGKVFFLLLRLFRKNEEESIAIECPGYPLAKHEDSRTIRLRQDTFPK